MIQKNINDGNTDNHANRVATLGMAALAYFSFSSQNLDAQTVDSSSKSPPAINNRVARSTNPGIKDQFIWKIADPVEKNAKSMGSHLGSNGIMCWTNRPAKELACIKFGKEGEKENWKFSGAVIEKAVPGNIRDAVLLGDGLVVVVSEHSKETQGSAYVVSFLDSGKGQLISSQIFSCTDLTSGQYSLQQQMPTRFRTPKFIKNSLNLYLVSDEGIIRIDSSTRNASTIASIDRSHSKAVFSDWTFTASGIFARIVEDDPTLSSVGKIARIKDSGGYAYLDIYKDRNVKAIAALGTDDLFVLHSSPVDSNSSTVISRITPSSGKEVWRYNIDGVESALPVNNLSRSDNLLIFVNSYIGKSNQTEGKFLVLNAKTGKVTPPNSPIDPSYTYLCVNSSEYMLESKSNQGKNTNLSLIPLKSFFEPMSKNGSAIDLGNISTGCVGYVDHTTEGTLIYIQNASSFNNGLIAIVPEQPRVATR